MQKKSDFVIFFSNKLHEDWCVHYSVVVIMTGLARKQGEYVD